MKATELMAGDLVRVNEDVCIKKGTIVEIHSIDIDNTLPKFGLKSYASCKPYNDQYGYQGGVWLDYLSPIPLSSDFFEKNGWERIGGGKYDKQYGLYDDYYEITAYEFNDGMWHVEYSCIEMGGIPPECMNICWLHELQHFLSHCAVEMKIKMED